MAKSQTNQATGAANSLIQQAQTQTQPFITGFGNLESGYNTEANNSFNAASGGYATQSQTGGYTPSQTSLLTSGYGNIAGNGGYAPSTLNTINSGYSNLAQGGYTPTQANQFIDQATEGTATTYNALEQQAKQDVTKTGGLGGTGALSQMARQGTQQQDQATLNAEVALNSQENQNRVTGLGGLASTANSVAGNKLAALGGFGNFAGSQASNINAANTGQANLFGTSAGAGLAAGNASLSALGLDFSTQDSAIASLVKLSQNPGAFQTGFGDMTSLIAAL